MGVFEFLGIISHFSVRLYPTLSLAGEVFNIAEHVKLSQEVAILQVWRALDSEVVLSSNQIRTPQLLPHPCMLAMPTT